MNENQPIIVIIAAILAVLTTVISRHTLRGHPVLGNPVIYICVGLIAFIGLCSCASKALPVIVLPYVTLALCLPLVLFLLLFFKSSKKSEPGPRERRMYDSSQREGEESPEHHRHSSSVDQEDFPDETDEKDD